MDFASNTGLMLHDRKMLSHSGIANCGAHASQLCTGSNDSRKNLQFGTIYAMRIVSPPVLIGMVFNGGVSRGKYTYLSFG